MLRKQATGYTPVDPKPDTRVGTFYYNVQNRGPYAQTAGLNGSISVLK